MPGVGLRGGLDTMPPSIDLSHTAFLLDIDGTLLDIAAHPDAVSVPGQLPCDLARLSCCVGGALALVSGRPLATIDTLFAPLRLPAIGGHGAEIRFSVDTSVPVIRAAPLPDAAKARLNAFAQRHKGFWAEDKNYSFAVHYRGVAEAEAEVLAEFRTVAAREPGLDVLSGKYVAELKRSGINKGAAVRVLMDHPPFAGRQPVFVGDDVTDEDALKVLPEFGGIGIAVGRPLAGASHLMAGPDDVRRWLSQIAMDCSE